MSGRPWTGAEDQVLLREYKTWCGYEEIARRIGRTRSAVKHRLHVLGATKGKKKGRRVPDPMKWEESEVELLKKLWRDKKKTMGDIKMALDRTTQYIQIKAEALGLGERPRPYRARLEGPKTVLTPWPRGVFFEDHPDTITSRTGGRYVRGEI